MGERADTFDTALTRANGHKKEKPAERIMLTAGVVGEDGFEPSKSLTTDLQSAPFGHSGTLPYELV